MRLAAVVELSMKMERLSVIKVEAISAIISLLLCSLMSTRRIGVLMLLLLASVLPVTAENLGRRVGVQSSRV